ncbi:putative leader peptide [Streptomyces aureus]
MHPSPPRHEHGPHERRGEQSHDWSPSPRRRARPPLVASLFTLRRHIDLARVSSATCR